MRYGSDAVSIRKMDSESTISVVSERKVKRYPTVILIFARPGEPTATAEAQPAPRRKLTPQ